MKNAYVEITNICNLSCDFCPGHDRAPRHMTADEFENVAMKLDGRVDNLFLHIMGEPLLHPELHKIFEIIDRMDVKLKLTTNGTMLVGRLPQLLACKKLHTVCISLHSFESNARGAMAAKKLAKYLRDCFESAEKLAKAGKFVVFRLWNRTDDEKKAKNSFNDEILRRIEASFPREKEEWVENHRGVRVATHVFLEWGERFEWPDLSLLEENTEIKMNTEEYGEDKCHGLLSQIGILSDGTIVPCCLDRNGDIPLGNIFETTLEEALSSPRAVRMKEAMAHRRFVEPLCHGCGFIRE